MFEGGRACLGTHWNGVQSLFSLCAPLLSLLHAPLFPISSLISKWTVTPTAPEHLRTPLVHSREAQFPWEERASKLLSLDKVGPAEAQSPVTGGDAVRCRHGSYSLGRSLQRKGGSELRGQHGECPPWS